MNNIRKYKIKTIYNEPVDVTFVHTTVPISSVDKRVNQVCTCIVRRQNSLFTASETVVKNPNDQHNFDIAEHQAFKRVIERLWRSQSIPFAGRSILKLKTISSFYRQQLWEAKNKSEDEINRALTDAGIADGVMP